MTFGAEATICEFCKHYVPTEWLDEENDGELTKDKAQTIINALQQGIPPQSGFGVFGCEKEKKIIENHLDKVSDGASRFLVINGDNGSGKSHLLQYISEKSLADNFVSSKISLKPECNFSDEITVYAELTKCLTLPDNRKADAIECISRAVGRRQLPPGVPGNIALAFEKAADMAGQQKRVFLDYISGRPVPILELRRLASFSKFKMRLEEGDFDPLIRGLVKIACLIEYSGLVLSFDEVESSLLAGPTFQKREKAISRVTELINNIDYFSNGYFVFAVTPDVLNILRVHHVQLDNSNCFTLSLPDVDDLILLGKEIRRIHSIAYEWQPESVVTDSILREISEKARAQRSNIREFVKTIAQLLNAKQLD